MLIRNEFDSEALMGLFFSQFDKMHKVLPEILIISGEKKQLKGFRIKYKSFFNLA